MFLWTVRCKFTASLKLNTWEIKEASREESKVNILYSKLGMREGEKSAHSGPREQWRNY